MAALVGTTPGSPEEGSAVTLKKGRGFKGKRGGTLPLPEGE